MTFLKLTKAKLLAASVLSIIFLLMPLPLLVHNSVCSDEWGCYPEPASIGAYMLAPFMRQSGQVIHNPFGHPVLYLNLVLYFIAFYLFVNIAGLLTTRVKTKKT